MKNIYLLCISEYMFVREAQSPKTNKQKPRAHIYKLFQNFASRFKLYFKDYIMIIRKFFYIVLYTMGIHLYEILFLSEQMPTMIWVGSSPLLLL